MKRSLLLLITFALFSCINTNQKNSQLPLTFNSTNHQIVTNIEAFARVYGYVRYFHPSEQALNIDWDKFAVYGVQQVKHAQSSQQLIQILNNLFNPLTSHIDISSSLSPLQALNISHSDTGDYQAWQHHGLGDQYSASTYKSSVLGQLPPSTKNGFVRYYSDKTLAGKYIRISADVKTELNSDKFGAALFLNVFSKRARKLHVDYMRDRLIRDENWQNYQISTLLSDSFAHLNFGAELATSGSAFFKNFRVYSSIDNKEWTEISVKNLDLSQVNNEGQAAYWYPGNKDLYQYHVDTENNVLKISSKPGTVPGAIFLNKPKLNSIITKDINNDIRVQLPLTIAIPAKSLINNAPYQALKTALNAIDLADTNNDNIRLANVVISWNILQHFYPYFDLIDTDWLAELSFTIEDALNDQTYNDSIKTLERMIAKIQDGHGAVWSNPHQKLYGLPIRVEWVEDNIVVTATQAEKFKVGDIIESINDISSKEILSELESYISGSIHLKRHRALNIFTTSVNQSIANVRLLRGEKAQSVSLQREPIKGNLFFNSISSFKYPSIKEVKPNVFYINMRNTEASEFKRLLPKLTTAKVLIFDTRWDGSPSPKDKITAIRDIIPHLTNKTLTSPNWQIPYIIYPDTEKMEFSNDNWKIPAREPYLAANTVYIISPPVVSSGETVTSFIDHYNLATTVGSSTAGTNGNINYINLIGGSKIWFTGMKVEKHDGSQLHLVGYEPDYPVAKTYESVINKRDLYLEKAIEIIEQ